MLSKISAEILNKIKIYCKQNSNVESCGVIVSLEGQDVFVECENLSKKPAGNFYINPRILIDYDVKYIVHSHTNCSSRPSENDIVQCNEICIPYLIYSLRDDDFFLYENISV